MAAEPMVVELIQIARSAESEAVRLRAVMDVLDRAGLTEKHVVEIGLASPFDDALADMIDVALKDVPSGRALPAGHDDELAVDDVVWEDDEPSADDLSYAVPGRTIEVPPPDPDPVPVITTLPVRSRRPAYLRRLTGEDPGGTADFS